MASLRHTIGGLGAPAKLALGALVATVGGGGVYFLSRYEVLLLHACLQRKYCTFTHTCIYLTRQPTCFLDVLPVFSCQRQMGPPHTVSQRSEQGCCYVSAKHAPCGKTAPRIA